MIISPYYIFGKVRFFVGEYPDNISFIFSQKRQCNCFFYRLPVKTEIYRKIRVYLYKLDPYYLYSNLIYLLNY